MMETGGWLCHLQLGRQKRDLSSEWHSPLKTLRPIDWRERLLRRTGETLTEAVINALRERLERELRKDQSIEDLIEDVMQIGRHCAALPLLDPRRPDEIIEFHF